MTFGERLKLLREEKELTQRALANLLKIGYSTLGMYETNKRSPDMATISHLADFFGVTVDYLLGRSADPHATKTNAENKKPKELLKFLEESEVMFDGETYNLDEEDKKKIRAALELAFWDAKEQNRKARAEAKARREQQK
jgi:Predicted transcriptional regulators